MLENSTRQPLVARLYYRFVEEGNAAQFIREVSTSYTSVTLQRVAQQGTRAARRGALLALTLLGRPDSIACVGEALRDEDRGVRLIAEQGLPTMWCRTGSFNEFTMLQSVMRLNTLGEFAEAIELADELLVQHPEFGEAWHQRAEAQRASGSMHEAIASLHRALEFEPYHYVAVWEMAECYLELGDAAAAVTCLQWVLQIHPHYELARVQLHRLQRDLREQADH